MAQREDEKSASDIIDVLGKPAQVALKGIVFEDRPDAITIQEGNSLFEIPKKFVLVTKELQATEGKRAVELTIAANAQVIQKIVVSAETLGSRLSGILRDGGGNGGACACACNCNCACECACSSREELAVWAEAAFRRSFGQAPNVQGLSQSSQR